MGFPTSARRLAGLLSLAALFAATSSAQAQPASPPTPPELPSPARLTRPERSADPIVRFEVAENTFRYQDYARTVELLEALLYPQPQIPDPEELLAREYLGASHWWLKSFQRAEEEFTSLLTRDPERDLDSFYYPAALIAFYEGVREKLVRLQLIARDEPVLEPRPEPAIVQERVVRERSLLLCFFPFGVGQFQNGHTSRGVAFLTIEALALATNIASYFLIDGLRESSGFIAPQNMDRARALEITLYTSLAVFAGTAVAGIIEALVSFEPRDEQIRTLVPEPSGAGPGTIGQTRGPQPGFSLGPTGMDFHLRF